MEDQLRVTVVATGLGGAVRMAAKPKLQPVQPEAYRRTGTDDMPVDVMGGMAQGSMEMGLPPVFHSGRGRGAVGGVADSMRSAGSDPSDIPAVLRSGGDIPIPAFLRRQAD